MAIKKLLLAGMLCISLMAKGQGPTVTSWVFNTTGLTGYNCSGCSTPHYGTIPANIQSVYYTTTDAYITCASIPSYNIGPWPGNPNVPSDQHLVLDIPRNPTPNTGTLTAVPMGHAGVWSNGVTIYNPRDGYYWDTTTGAFGNTMGVTGQWNRNAALFEAPSFDACLGHPDQSGSYHNHINPKCLYDATASTVHSPIIGYAFDGYPVYGAYAYTDTNGTGAITRMRSSYVLTTDTTRVGGPTMRAYAAGSFCEDYVYTAGAGDLDIHNGRYCVTPEYPGGTYAYFVTIDASGNPVYPFVLGPTYYGIVNMSDIGPTGGHVTVPGGATQYTPPITAIAEVGGTINTISLYPNPVGNDDIQFHVTDNTNDLYVSICDFQGRVFISRKFAAGSYGKDLTLSAPYLSTGLYIISFECAGTKMSKKLEIIEN